MSCAICSKIENRRYMLEDKEGNRYCRECVVRAFQMEDRTLREKIDKLNKGGNE